MAARIREGGLEPQWGWIAEAHVPGGIGRFGVAPPRLGNRAEIDGFAMQVVSRDLAPEQADAR